MTTAKLTPRAVLSSLLEEGKAHDQAARTKTSGASAPAGDTEVFTQSRIQQLRRGLKVSSQLASSLERLGQVGFEKVAMVETAEPSVSPVPGPVSNGAPAPISNSGQSFSDTTNGQPTRLEDARRTAGDLKLDQGNLSNNGSPTVAGGPMPTVVGPDNSYAQMDSEVADAVTKESAARVLRKLSNGRTFHDQRAALAAANRLNIRDSLDALRVFTKSAQIRSKTPGEFLAGMDLRNHDRATMFREQAIAAAHAGMRKRSEASILGGTGGGLDAAVAQAESEIIRAKDTVESLVRSDQTLPTSSVVMQAANVSAPAANAALTEVAEFIAAVGGQVVSPEQAAAMAAMNAGGGAPAGPMPTTQLVGGLPPGGPMPAGPPMGPPAAIPPAAAPPAPMPAGDPAAAAAGGAPPTDPNAGMQVTSSARQFAAEIDDLLLKLSADESDLDLVTKVMDTGAEQPSDNVLPGGTGYDGTPKSQPTSSMTNGASNRLAQQVASPAGQAATGQDEIADHQFANADKMISNTGDPVNPSTVMGSGGEGATPTNTIQRTRTTDVPTPEYGKPRDVGHTTGSSADSNAEILSKISSILDV